MVANTSMQQNLLALEKAYPVNFTYLYINDFDLMEAMVARGDADFTVIDGDRAFSALNQYDNLTIGWPISAPKMMGWAVNKNNKTLTRILEKYIQYAQQTGVLDKYWKASYGVTFIEYLRVLKLGGSPHQT